MCGAIVCSQNRYSYVPEVCTIVCGGEMEHRRLRIVLSEEDKDRTEAYARVNGLRMPHAYGELIRAGLEASDDDYTDDNDTESNDGN